MDLIIKIRLEALQNNLNKIKCIPESVEGRRTEIDNLIKSLTVAEDKLKLVGDAVTNVLNTSRNTWANKEIHPSLMELLMVAEKEALDLRQELQKTKEGISAIQTRWTLIDENFEAKIRKDLDKRTNWSIIDEDIRALGGPPSNTGQLEEAWRHYSEIMSEQSQVIFSEYVEFLGGLALRATGLDEGICRIADELMQSCFSLGKGHWSLIIPAGQEAMALALSIRMRFPEWTIWAVPLTAHELGQVMISNNDDLKNYIQTRYPGRMTRARESEHQRMRVCLADAFAAYVMGPAYACAVILLRLNPVKAYEDKGKSPADAKRAHIVLNTLKIMKGGRNITPPYVDILAKLETEWDAALAQAQTQAPATWNQDVNVLDEWTDRLLAELGKSYPASLYQGRLWDSTLEALQDSLKGKEPGDQLKGNEKWRDVLNAAWACRVNNLDTSQRIAGHAEKLWQEIEKKKREIKDRQSSPSGPPVSVPRIGADKK